MMRPYFHKLVLSSTIQDGRLRIPDNFIKKLRDELSVVSTINVPDGHVWHIGIKKVDNRFWFHEGWQDFVEHYSIGVGYFLVFRYGGNSIFNIHIFNLTTSEIDYHSNGRQGPQYGRQLHVFMEMEEDDPADLFGSSESLKRKSIGDSSAAADHLGLNRGFSTITMQTPSNGSVHQQKSALGSHAGGVRALPNAIVQAGGIKFRNGEDGVSRARKKRKSDLNQLISGSLPDEDSSYASASTRKRTATTEERERAMNAAKIYEPLNPCCRVVVRPSYLYRGCIMYLPSCFAEKHLSGVSGHIKLQTADGRQWSVRCLYRGGRARLSQGWYDFSLQNNLAEGDVCVFELIKAREVVLEVTLFRVKDEGRLMYSNQHV